MKASEQRLPWSEAVPNGYVLRRLAPGAWEGFYRSADGERSVGPACGTNPRDTFDYLLDAILGLDLA